MKILVLGSGGREHTLCWKLSQSSLLEELICIPGNGGIKKIAKCIDLNIENNKAIVDFAVKEDIDLVIVGPEAPLVNGIADDLVASNIKVFGPTKKGAKLEGSKAYSKIFMKKYNIPTAKYRIYDDIKKAKENLKEFNPPFVIKADGLAAGKGVYICKDTKEALKAIDEIMKDRKFGKAGENIVIEEFLEGTEASLLCLVRNNKIIPLESARDYKKVFDGDIGPNTGGMGCFSPNPLFTDELKEYIDINIIKNIEEGLKKEKISYTGILFIGLMIENNKAKVLEFNVRFGDPETQVVIPRLENDLLDIINKTIDETISKDSLNWKKNFCVTVVLTSGGYPKEYEKNKLIKISDSIQKDIMVFHSGTKEIESNLYTNGGRVLAVTALGQSLEKARKKVYNSIQYIKFDEMQYRKDIAKL